MENEAFTKYEERGAYHWQELAVRNPAGYSARLHALYAWFVGEAGRRQPELVVDVGCGDAALTHRIAASVAGRVVGVEPEPAGVEFARAALARAQSRAEVVTGRGEDLPFADDEVEMVVLCEVVEHIDPVEPLLAEAARVLRPGGALLVSTPQWQTPELRPFHVREFRSGELAETLQRFFSQVDVLVSEPPRLYDSYLSNVIARLAVNSLALAGLNPFARRRPASPARERWRELHAVATP